jgi:hypothetical protein
VSLYVRSCDDYRNLFTKEEVDLLNEYWKNHYYELPIDTTECHPGSKAYYYRHILSLAQADKIALNSHSFSLPEGVTVIVKGVSSREEARKYVR